MNNAKLIKQLANYVPQGTAPVLAKWIIDYTIQVRISPPRSSKLGDYRAPHNGQGHRISINGSLNPYAFLITFIHEVAHLVTWNEYKHTVQPHGVEWKVNFIELMRPFLTEKVFPNKILVPLKKYMINPAASSCQDNSLQKVLEEYNPGHKDRDWKYLEELPKGAFFIIEDGRVFQKLDKLRKNFKCLEVGSQKMFRIAPIIKVKELKK